MYDCFDCEHYILEIMIKGTISFTFKMWFKIVFLFTYKETSYFTVMCDLSLFVFLLDQNLIMRIRHETEF
jgi:hypothetical protein